ncbi:hypothetical protein CYK06_10550 [Staphylococcus hominis]|nr:hypothetical protein CYK06_10550 [Staphylococcus hominis]
MIFIYIIFSAILLYYVLKYGNRNGFAELEANKDNQDKKKLVFNSFQNLKLKPIKLLLFLFNLFRLFLK